MSLISNILKKLLYKSLPVEIHYEDFFEFDYTGLPDKYIHVVYLYAEGNTVKQISNILNVEEKWVLSVLRRVQYLGRL